MKTQSIVAQKPFSHFPCLCSLECLNPTHCASDHSGQSRPHHACVLTEDVISIKRCPQTDMEIRKMLTNFLSAILSFSSISPSFVSCFITSLFFLISSSCFAHVKVYEMYNICCLINTAFSLTNFIFSSFSLPVLFSLPFKTNTHS